MDFGKLFGDLDLDQVKDVVELVTSNKDALALLGRLPEYLEKVADGLAGAGEQARSAAVALVGDDGRSGVRATLADSAEALSAIVASISAGADRIADAAESAAKVPLMDGPASRLASAAEEMGATTDRLGQLSTAMTTIGETLGTVAAALAKLGDHLDDSGSQARGFAALPSAGS
ncbi:MAG: hypothetical protein R2731_17815 [Nocardioides sp.]